VLLTCWGAPRVDAAVLDAAPNLRAIVHAAGSVKGMLDPVVWGRGLVVSSGADANAVPVAEYAVAMIVLAGKNAFAAAHAYTSTGQRPPVADDVGNFGRTVGLVGASRVGRRTLERLRSYDFELLLSDPFLSAEQAAGLGAELVPLDELCRRSTIVSLHAPAVPSTERMIGRTQLALMPDGATLINTARGWILDHDALLDEVTTGRLNAILDVSTPEPPPADSPFFHLPNVLMTPHIAGAQGLEIGRLGESAVRELQRYAAGEPFAHPVLAAELDHIA
jgi:phosphoglycerate dehydrogenase-like enzyme